MTTGTRAIAALSGFLTDCPVKLGAMAEQLGVKVLLSTLPRGISGRIDIENEGFVIRINRHEARPRQRFTLAHILAHALLHSDRIVEAGGWSENVLLRTAGQPVEIEHEANRLALDLVVPPALLEKAISAQAGPVTRETIEVLALRFCVPQSLIESRVEHKMSRPGHG